MWRSGVGRILLARERLGGIRGNFLAGIFLKNQIVLHSKSHFNRHSQIKESLAAHEGGADAPIAPIAPPFPCLWSWASSIGGVHVNNLMEEEHSEHSKFFKRMPSTSICSRCLRYNRHSKRSI